MKRVYCIVLALALVLSLCACGAGETPTVPVTETWADAIHIALGDTVTVTGDTAGAVYTDNDIVYYEAGHDYTYGEGTEADAHTPEEAAGHTVVHITRPGTYLVTGTLTLGQIAVDLGEEAADDPNAVVTLVLGGADITCTVAPAVIFYNVYECGSDDADTATYAVDTTAAGANVIIADGTVNNVRGSHVARIYKSVELSEDGTEVVDSKKLHKYDGAFYSKMSMNVSGGTLGSGTLNIEADNEGLDSELHLTINGGNIKIASGNDGINTNEDYVSVTTINGGSLEITVTGTTGEGDGIDSNGWLVINGGTVIAQACSTSGDAGIDSDMGIHINGGTVMAFGNMLDAIGDSGANYGVFRFAQRQQGGQTVTLKNHKEDQVLQWVPVNAYQYLIVADPALSAGDYTLYVGDTQQGHTGTMGGMQRPGGFKPEDMEGMEPPEGFDPGQIQRPEGMERPEGFDPGQMQRPEGMEPPEGFDPGQMQRPNDRGEQFGGELTEVFTIPDGGITFGGVTGMGDE